MRAADTGFKDNPSNLDSEWCLGYLRGFLAGFDAMALAQSKAFGGYQALTKKYVCFPEHSTIGQDARVLVKWLNDHPERLHEDGGWLTLAAFLDAYPCQSNPAAPPKKAVKKE